MPQPRIVLAKDATATGVPIVGIAQKITPSYSVAPDLTELFTYAIPAGAMANLGDMIELEVYGHVAAGTGQQIKATIAGVAILDTGLRDDLVGDYVLRGYVVRASATTVNVAATLSFAAVHVNHIDASFDFDASVANDLVVNGLGPTNNDVSVALAIVNFRGEA